MHALSTKKIYFSYAEFGSSVGKQGNYLLPQVLCNPGVDQLGS
jgi:hypothetical protein